MLSATADPATAYERDGVAIVPGVLDAPALAIARGELERLVPDHAVVGPYASIVHDPWRRSSALEALIRQFGAIACRVARRPELVLFHDHLLRKPPGGADMDWHQDFSYVPLDRAGGLTMWIALDDVTVEHGCLYYVLGSHRHGERRARWGMTGDDDLRAKLPALEVEPDDLGVAAPAGPGCALVYHSLLVHRSPANRAERPRRSWQMSFVLPEARWSPSHSPHPRSAVSPRCEGQALEDDLIHVFAGGDH